MPPVIDTAIPDIVTGPGAGQILGVSREYVLRLRDAGRLPCRIVTAPPPADPAKTTLFVVFRKDLVEQYQRDGLPAATGKLEVDAAIPKIVNSAWAAGRLGVEPQDIYQLWKLRKLRGRPALGAAKPGGRQSTSVLVFQPEEIQWALQARTTVTEYRWAPARP